MVWLAFGMVLFSLVITHAWWATVRVVRFRQDIFDMRDRLFDIAASLQVFDDPAYQDARGHFNAVARIADSISFYGVCYALCAGVGDWQRPRSENAELQKAIDDIHEECAGRFGHYLLRETFTGLVAVPFRVHMAAPVQEQVRRWIRHWLISQAPESLDLARHGVLPQQ